MSECPDCDEPQTWGGQGWVPHSPTYHAAVRRRLLVRASRILRRVSQLTFLRGDAAWCEDILIYWRNGVFHDFEVYTRVPGRVWDTTDQAALLYSMRTNLAWQMNARYGVTVNQATWLHHIYDDRDEMGL